MKPPMIHFLIALVVGITALFGYGAWYAALSAKSNDVANLQSRIVSASEMVGRIASARAALTGIASDESVIREYFVPETAVVGFINDLEARGLAQNATVSVLSVATGGSGTQPTLLLSLAVKGTFDAVMRTIGTIEYAPYASSISSLSIEQDAKGEWHANLKLVTSSLPANTVTRTP